MTKKYRQTHLLSVIVRDRIGDGGSDSIQARVKYENWGNFSKKVKRYECEVGKIVGMLVLAIIG